MLSSIHCFLGLLCIMRALQGGRGNPDTKLLSPLPNKPLFSPYSIPLPLALGVRSPATVDIDRWGHNLFWEVEGFSALPKIHCLHTWPRSASHHYSHNTHSDPFIEKIYCGKVYYFKYILNPLKLTSERKIRYFI